MRLVFVHGINHQNQSSDWVREEWIKALAATLSPADLARVQQETISTPYYGDVLYQATENLTQTSGDLQSQSAGAVSGDEATFYRDVLTELVRDQNIPQGLIDSEEDLVPQGPMFHNRRIIAMARALEILSPFHGRILLRVLPQAFTYLNRAQATAAVDAVVRPELEKGPCIVVAHSLGTIVTYKLMRELKQVAPFYLTIGSPLGIRAVQGPIGTPFGRRPGVQRWLNVFDKDDFVTLGRPLDSATFGSGVENVDVDNGTDDAHDFQKYLGHPDVGAALMAAIKAAVT